MASTETTIKTAGSGYRTIIVGAIVTLLGALQGLDWINIVHDPKTAGWVVTGIGIVMMALRYFTTTPIAVPATPTTPISRSLP